MSGSVEDGERDAAARRARIQQAESRMVLAATMQAKRSGQLPPRRDTTASETFTALAVIVALIGTLALAIRYGG
jgi:hypothetical protein